METPSDRLRKAQERAGRSIRSLQQALEAANVPGSSYANVHAYFQGKTQPTVAFLEAAAEELGVRAAWLAFGDREAMTQAELGDQITREILPGISFESYAMAQHASVIEGFREHLGDSPRETVLAVLLEVWRRMGGQASYHDVAAEEGLLTGGLETAMRLGKALGASLEGLGHRPDDLHPADFDEYVMTAALAIARLEERTRDREELKDVINAYYRVRRPTHEEDNDDA